MTSSDRSQRAQELFCAAIKLPAAERQAFLDVSCADSESLRREVESLLAEDENSSASLARRFGLNRPSADKPVFSPGARLGPYEIADVVGLGGMGEVYRARDTKLNRDVAVKVLPEAFARDKERVARLNREALLLASLTNPHIAAIYTLEEYDQGLALIMEFVEGPTLADRIKKGPIPFEEASEIASQIAEALEAAHNRGIVHRDLKPANVKSTPEGPVKILDYGLGKALKPDSPERVPPDSATLSRPGLILGTAAYMSPEQARAAAVDRRADVWSFGVLIYEMLTGKRPFAGATEADTITAVLTGEPDWQRTPRRAQRSLRLCLQKDPERRLHSAWDACVLLNEQPPDPPLAPRAPAPGSAQAASEPLIFGPSQRGAEGILEGIQVVALWRTVGSRRHGDLGRR